MIPGRILRFLHEQSNMAFGGIRDRNLRPSGCRVSAWQMAPDGRTLTALVPLPGQFRERFLEALRDNGQFAMTVEEHPTHETYQLKGTYLGHRDAGPGDMPLVQRHRERLARAMRAEMPPGTDLTVVLLMMLPTPDVAVDIDVKEVYLQTPGPGAGSRLYPPDPGA
jgi:hypothetical protein